MYATTRYIVMDLETMGINPHTPIMQIGACVLDIDNRRGSWKIHDDLFQEHLSLSENMASGRTPDASTIMWWIGQSAEARTALVNGNNNATLTLEALMHKFVAWYQTYNQTNKTAKKILPRIVFAAIHQANPFDFKLEHHVASHDAIYEAIEIALAWQAHTGGNLRKHYNGEATE